MSPAAKAVLADAINGLADQYEKLGDNKKAADLTEEAVAICQPAAEASPGSSPLLQRLAGSLGVLGRRLTKLGEHVRAVEASEKAVAACQTLVASDSEGSRKFMPALAASLNNLGAICASAGRRREALEATQAAVVTYKALSRSEPDKFNVPLARALSNMSADLAVAGDNQGALAYGSQAVTVLKERPASDESGFRADLGAALSNLAEAKGLAGQHQSALQDASEAVLLYRGLASAEPDTFRQAFASALDNFGGHLEVAGRTTDAVETTREALKLLKDSDAPDPAEDMAAAQNNLAARLATAGQTQEAIAEMEQAVELNRRLASKKPGVGNVTLVTALRGLGDLYAETGDQQKSEAKIKEAETLRASLETSKDLIQYHSFIPVGSASRARLIAAVEIGEITERSLAISADGSWFCVGGFDRFVHVFSAFTGKEFTGKHFPLFSRHHQKIIATSMSSDGSRIVSLGDDNFGKLWDFVSMKYLQALRLAEETPQKYDCIALSSNGRRIIAAGSDVQIAEDKSRKILETDAVRSLAIALDGSRILVAQPDGIVALWDGHQSRLLRRYGHDQSACRVATTPALSHVVVGMTNGEIALFKPEGEPITQYPGHSCEVISLATSSTHVLSASEDGSVCLWDLTGNRHEASWQCKGARPHVGISEQGSRIVFTNGKVIELWHLPDQ